MALMAKILFLLFSVCFISVHSYEYVPVYMWETSKNYSPLPALGRINEEFFRDILLDKLNKDKVVVVFLEENLSPEDFNTFDAAGNNVFYSLSHIKSSAQVNYYPFVEAPLKAVESLPGIKVSKVEVTADGLPKGTKIEPGQVLIVDLNDAKENEARSQMLSRHDTLMTSIYKSIVAEHKNVISLYTAIHSSWLVPSELEGSGRKARHLMADTTASAITGTIINVTTNLMYISGPIIFSAQKINNPAQTWEIKGCEGFDVVNYTKLTCTSNTTAKPEIDVYFKSSLGYWLITNIEVKNYGVADDVANFKVRELYAPYGFSYHCNNSQFTADVFEQTKIVATYKISIPGLQVESYLNTSVPQGFSEAYDCVGFTTAPIWSGLFVTFLLALIMTFGLCMIMDIKTMDRFDDPKGKTISINASE